MLQVLMTGLIIPICMTVKVLMVASTQSAQSAQLDTVTVTTVDTHVTTDTDMPKDTMTMIAKKVIHPVLVQARLPVHQAMLQAIHLVLNQVRLLVHLPMLQATHPVFNQARLSVHPLMDLTLKSPALKRRNSLIMLLVQDRLLVHLVLVQARLLVHLPMDQAVHPVFNQAMMFVLPAMDQAAHLVLVQARPDVHLLTNAHVPVAHTIVQHHAQCQSIWHAHRLFSHLIRMPTQSISHRQFSQLMRMLIQNTSHRQFNQLTMLDQPNSLVKRRRSQATSHKLLHQPLSISKLTQKASQLLKPLLQQLIPLTPLNHLSTRLAIVY